MKVLLNVDEVAELCKEKKAKAYSIMKEVNQEMEERGYIVIRGRVNGGYLLERLGLNKEVLNN